MVEKARKALGDACFGEDDATDESDDWVYFLFIENIDKQTFLQMELRCNIQCVRKKWIFLNFGVP